MTHRLRTVIIGFGKIGARYADDPLTARYYPYSTHAQVLAVHPAFAWEAVVDPSATARELAQKRWQIPYAVKNVRELMDNYQPEVAVIATPPETRQFIIEQIPSLRAVLVEKPLGLTVADAEQFLEQCRQRHIIVQVNLWRRADEMFRALAAGQLTELIGCPQAIFGVYGNGLLNNGTHMIDFVRMLCGEVEAVQAIGNLSTCLTGPITGDVNLAFSLRLKPGLVVMQQPINFEHYRENSLDIWGEKGRLSFCLEGLSLIFYPRHKNRAIQHTQEIAVDQPQLLNSTVGQALYHLYSNLAESIQIGIPLWSPGDLALHAAQIIQAILDSARDKNKIVECNQAA
ncbi:MAG: Gfo/Idh/MocA family oxidoreductase [Anaerolineae bacterium]